MASQKGSLKFMMTDEPYFMYTERKHQKDCTAMLEKAKELLAAIGKLAESVQEKAAETVKNEETVPEKK